MNLLIDTLLWGIIVGLIHFVIIGFLYQNPIVSKIYKSFEEHPAVKKNGIIKRSTYSQCSLVHK